MVCKLVLQVLNDTHFHGLEKFYQALYHRPEGRGLITVSNHTSSVDDPAVLAALSPLPYLMDSKQIRWAMCATDRCFNKGEALSNLFRTIKVLPVERGAGLEQKYMYHAIHKLDNGDWIHIFPEGTRHPDGVMGSLKPGIGKLILGAKIPPVVLPIIHINMNKVMPKGSNIPNTGNRVTIVVGDPIYFDDVVAEIKHKGESFQLYNKIIARLTREMKKLYEIAMEKHRLFELGLDDSGSVPAAS